MIDTACVARPGCRVGFSPLHEGEDYEALVDGWHLFDRYCVSVPFTKGRTTKHKIRAYSIDAQRSFSPLHEGEDYEAAELEGVGKKGAVSFSPLHEGEDYEAIATITMNHTAYPHVSVPFTKGRTTKPNGEHATIEPEDSFSPLHEGEDYEAHDYPTP